MLAKGFLLVILIVFSAVLALIALIIGMVKYSSNTRGAKNWFIGFFISLAILVGSVYYLTTGIVNKGKEFVENMGQMQMEQLSIVDSLANMNWYNTDSVMQSKQVEFLIELESDDQKGKVPTEFYSYLGFRDYYRLPLKYPFSLHCIDSLGLCELYNETNVIRFDVNDNGEEYTGLNGIAEFIFDNNYLIGTKMNFENNTYSKHYFVFDFSENKIKDFKSKKELLLFAKENNFSENFEFYTSKSYSQNFSLY